MNIHVAPPGHPADMIGPAIPKLRTGRYFSEWLLERRRRADEPSLFTRRRAG